MRPGNNSPPGGIYRRSASTFARKFGNGSPICRIHRFIGTASRWDFGDLPMRVQVNRMGMKLDAFPALIDLGGGRPPSACSTAPRPRSGGGGARRLFMTQVRSELQRLARTLPGIERMLIIAATFTRGADFTDDLLAAIADRAIFGDASAAIRPQAEFVQRAEAGWKRLPAAADEVAELAGKILGAYHAAHAARIARLSPLGPTRRAGHARPT